MLFAQQFSNSCLLQLNLSTTAVTLITHAVTKDLRKSWQKNPERILNRTWTMSLLLKECIATR